MAVQEREDETYVLTLSDTTLHYLGDLETFVWKALDGQRTGEELVDLICTDYQVDRDEAKQDLADFLARMETAGLISVS